MNKQIKNIILLLCLMVVGGSVNAQFLKNLAKKAQHAAERTIGNRTEKETEKTVDAAMDSLLGNPGSSEADAIADDRDYNTAKNINTEAKRSFYRFDVVIHTVNEKNETTDTYFDADELAVRALSSKSDDPIYIDSEAYQYAYNEHEKRWEKNGLMRTDVMSFMTPMISMSMLKLPPEPTLEATNYFRDNGMQLNTFQLVEWVFIYKPGDFRSEDYTEMQEPCSSGGSCSTFWYNDPEYKGTYVQFDNQDRLSKIVAHVNNLQAQGSGSFEFDYDTPVSVKIPSAVEIKMPLQDVLSKGLNVDDN